jgi:hypothetical protein
MNSILSILYTQTRRKIEVEKVLKKNLYVLCYEEGSAISRPSLRSGPSILYFKTGNKNKTITNPLKHVANCRATSRYKTLAEALDFLKLRLIMEGRKNI